MRAFGPLMGAIISSAQREGGLAKGKRKEVATPRTPKPGGPQAASTHDNAGHDEWSDSDGDDDDDDSE